MYPPSGNLYKLKNGGDKSDNINTCNNINNNKNMATHLRKKSIKEGMVKHSYSGCEGESIKYHRKKANNNYKSINNSGSYYGTGKYTSTLPPSPPYNQSLDATNSQYHQYYHSYNHY